jgi:hypothetical protein
MTEDDGTNDRAPGARGNGAVVVAPNFVSPNWRSTVRPAARIGRRGLVIW